MSREGLQNHKKVILFSVPTKWRFWDYVVGVNNLIEDWYQNDLSEEAQILFDGLLKNNSKILNHLEWGIRRFLEGKYKSERIWELGFVADKRNYRVLGIFGHQRKQAILLMGCYHKGSNYTPTEALDTAYKRAKNLREGKASLHERKINTDF